MPLSVRRCHQKNCCVYLFFQAYFTATCFWRCVPSIFFLNSKRYRTMLPDSFSEHSHLPISLQCFILFTGYLLSRGSNTSCLCSALRSFLTKPSSAFQNFFTFTLLPGSSALLHTPECSEYDPSKHRPVVSALSLTRLQLYGTNTLFLPVMLSLSVLLIYLNLP